MEGKKEINGFEDEKRVKWYFKYSPIRTILLDIPL
jgi:hypothetical protein